MRSLAKLALVLFWIQSTIAQTCPKGFHSANFPPGGQVQIVACIEDEVGLGKQSVYWGAKNLANDKLHIKFTKVVYTKCGTVLRSQGDTYLKPGEFVGGATFSGEITFETQVWKDDCNAAKYRVEKVAYENLIVENLSQKERENEAKIFLDSKREEQMRTEKQRKADESTRERERMQANLQQQQTALRNQQTQQLQDNQNYIKESNERLQQNMNVVQKAGDDLRNSFDKINQEKRAREGLAEEYRVKQQKLSQEQSNDTQNEFLICTGCLGKGHTDCGQCRSSGRIECSVCGGTGTKDFLNSKITCPRCTGKGSYKCFICDGIGHNNCSRCSGQGKVKNFNYNPPTQLPVETINSNFERLVENEYIKLKDIVKGYYFSTVQKNNNLQQYYVEYIRFINSNVIVITSYKVAKDEAFKWFLLKNIYHTNSTILNTYKNEEIMSIRHLISLENEIQMEALISQILNKSKQYFPTAEINISTGKVYFE